jgi:hypothetical protein
VRLVFKKQHLLWANQSIKKSDGITAIQKLLALLDIEHAPVIPDTMAISTRLLIR